MDSPFPGMDPYIEKHWLEVHQRLVTYSGDALQHRLPDALRARVEERVFVESESPQWRVVYPDVHVVEHQPNAVGPTSTDSGTVAAEPIVLEIVDEPMRQGYIAIYDGTTGNKVVTVIEFISPSNKTPGPGQEAYLQKRREIYAAQTSLVEIDLVRSGARTFWYQHCQIPPPYRATYQICVRRSWNRRRTEFYPIKLSERLPAIRIPLREQDEDAILVLQPLIDMCYRNGRYTDIDYRADPNPSLSAEDAIWADQMLREKGLR